MAVELSDTRRQNAKNKREETSDPPRTLKLKEGNVLRAETKATQQISVPAMENPRSGHLNRAMNQEQREATHICRVDPCTHAKPICCTHTLWMEHAPH